MNRKMTGIIILLILIIASGFIFRNFIVSDDDYKEVNIYFSDQEAMYLVPEQRSIETDNLYYNIMEELISGPTRADLHATIPEGAAIKNIEISDSICQLDFNREFIENHWGGSAGERMTIYSIVNTLTQLDDIEEVVFLIEGQRIESLSGHMDLTTPVSGDRDIIAD